jgi:hypothetical protein
VTPGPGSYIFGSIGLLAFLGTAYFYDNAAELVPPWAMVVLWLAYLGLLVFAVYLMRLAPAWVLAVPVLSMIALAVLTGALEIIALFLR